MGYVSTTMSQYREYSDIANFSKKNPVFLSMRATVALCLKMLANFMSVRWMLHDDAK